MRFGRNWTGARVFGRESSMARGQRRCIFRGNVKRGQKIQVFKQKRKIIDPFLQDGCRVREITGKARAAGQLRRHGRYRP